jgi:Leucine-rich repeat (LRR) protein
MNQLQQLLNSRFTAEEKKNVKVIGIANKSYENTSISATIDGRVEYLNKEKNFFYLDAIIDNADFTSFPNLETLSIFSGDGAKLQVGKIITNTALTTLYLYNNQLTNIDLSKNTALTTLNLQSNKLTNIDLSKNTALTTLYLQSNKLTNIDLSKNTALTTLNLYNNQLTNIDLSKNTNLTTLYLNNNQLTNIDLSKNTALTTLYLNNNQLTNIDLSKNTALTTLNLQSNKLETITVADLDKITSFNCDNNLPLTQNNEPKTLIKKISKLIAEKNNQIQQLEEDSENKKKQLEKEIEEYKNKINQKEHQEIALSNQIQELQRKLTEETQQSSEQEKELKNQIKLLQDLIISNRKEIKEEWVQKEQQWGEMLENYKKIVQDQEGQIQDLQTKIVELQEEIRELEENENFGENYEALQEELDQAKEEIKELKILLSERTPPSYDYLNNIFNNINNNFQQTKQNVENENNLITEQIEKIVGDDEKSEEFLESLENEEHRLYHRNKNFFLDWLLEFTKLDPKFSFKAFINLYPKLDTYDHEDFVEEVKKDLLITYICENEKTELIPYLLSTRRIKKKLKYMITDVNVPVVRFFMDNIGKSDNKNSFYGSDPVFTSQCWKIVRQSEKQKKIKELKESIIDILNYWKNNIDLTYQKDIERTIKILSSEQEKNKNQLESLKEFLNKCPSSNKILDKSLLEWRKLSGDEEVVQETEENKRNWEEYANYIKKLNKLGFLSSYCRKKKWDEKNFRKVMNAFLDSIYGTINKDPNYHWLPDLKPNKSFEDTLLWKEEGVYFGHKTAEEPHDHLGSYTPPPLKFQPKPKKDEENKKSIYSWYSSGSISIKDFNNLQKLAAKGECNLYAKIYLLEEIKDLLKKTEPKDEPKEDKDKIYTGWLTDDNITFILKSNDFEIITDKSIIDETDYFSVGEFTVFTDLANIYNSFYRAKNKKEWDLDKFINKINVNEYSIFPLRISGNHWGMFIIQKNNYDYQAYYTSSGSYGITNEIKQIQPLITQLIDEKTAKNIKVLVGDKQKDGYNCGVYLLLYIKDILETQKLELKRKYTNSEIRAFREKWHNLLGDEKWCKEDFIKI